MLQSQKPMRIYLIMLSCVSVCFELYFKTSLDERHSEVKSNEAQYYFFVHDNIEIQHLEGWHFT